MGGGGRILPLAPTVRSNIGNVYESLKQRKKLDLGVCIHEHLGEDVRDSPQLCGRQHPTISEIALQPYTHHTFHIRIRIQGSPDPASDL